MEKPIREEGANIEQPIFQNYHRHSTYTNVKIADSVVSNEDYARRAAELGHGIISSCEHGYQGRYIEAFNLAQKYGLQFLFSAEAYWVWDRTQPDRTNCHIWIGAKNENGREWINEVLSQANETGFYGQPRLDPELLELLPADDVWITTACVAGWKYREEEEERLIQFYKALHKKHGDNFFFEVQYHNTLAQKELNRYILQLREQIPAPIIMGCDSHYIKEFGGQDRTDFLASKEMYYEDEQGWYLDYPDGQTAIERFRKQGVLSENEILQALENTNCFLEVEPYDCDIFDKSIKLISLYPDWTQKQKDAEYERLVWQGWDEYKPNVPETLYKHYEDEIEAEVDTVKECFMADYFIDNYHIIRRGKELGGHLTNSGRGSAVSFVTNMLLGFTMVDRIAARVKMYPERFMTATRILETNSLPDIDFNVAEQEIFAQAQKDVLGDDHSYQMIAYGTQKASSAWKMFAKSQGVDFQTSNVVSGQIKRYEDKIKHVSEDEKDDVSIYDYVDKKFHDIYRKSEEYQGIIVSWSPAPCAFLLYQGSIRRKIGLIKIKDKICCLMDGHWAEENHFLKNDLLRVAVVDLISKGYERAGVPMPSVNDLIEMCPPDDPAWDIYKKGCTLGINQVEQPGTSSRVGTYGAQNISELCAFIAAIRPGFKSMYKTFENREPFSYGVESFDKLMRTEELPQSFCLYQEQQMAALNYAGFPMSECYAVIKDIAKKRAEKVLAYKDRFIEGFSTCLIKEEDIPNEEAAQKSNMVWQILEDSARYSFNASHSYCMALDSLYGAWLKAHHPLAFYETYMRIMEEKGDKEKLTAAKDEAENYFKIKFPPFRFGQDNRLITACFEDNTISNSLSSIKGFGRQIGEALFEIAQMQPRRFVDVLLALSERGIKSAAESLIKIDYFLPFGNDTEMFRVFDMFTKLKQGTAKTMKRETVDGTWLEPIIQRHANGLTKKGEPAKSYNITDMYGLLCDIEDAILAAGLSPLAFKTKIQNQQDVLGYIDMTTGKEEERRTFIVTDIFNLVNDGRHWANAVIAKSIGSGKTERLTIRTSVFDKNPFSKNNILSAPYKSDITKNKSGYWYLNRYDKVI